MAEDVFDVVNEQDEVVCQMPRSRVHAEHLRHRAAHVLIFNQNKSEILLQKRSATKDSYPLCYTTSCSGHVDAGESYEVAVLRELAEETGLILRLDQMEYLGKISPCLETGFEFTAVWVAQISQEQDLKFLPEEIDSFSWIPLEKFELQVQSSPEMFTPSFLKVFQFYKSNNKMGKNAR